MSEAVVGVRELKARLSYYLRRVQSGEIIVVTDHGRPISRIVPAEQPLTARLQVLAQSGLLEWSGTGLAPLAPVAQTRAGQSVAELLVEDRE